MKILVKPAPHDWGSIGQIQRILGRQLSQAKPGDRNIVVIDGDNSDLLKFRGTLFTATKKRKERVKKVKANES